LRRAAAAFFVDVLRPISPAISRRLAANIELQIGHFIVEKPLTQRWEKGKNYFSGRLSANRIERINLDVVFVVEEH
jgi:hypothetical protein